MDFTQVKYNIEEFFNGKFEVKKFLGEGSFAKVYLVNHNYLDTLMAMKIVKQPLSPAASKKDVFREVTLASQLRHENIISIYDAAEISGFEDGKNHAYFLMEYVSGGDLGEYLNSFAENGIFIPVGRCLNLTGQILRGLNTLHSANPPIVHRDLKPNNVLLSFNDLGDIIIKISDFGFAKEVTTGISDIDIAGTRPYMAPELFNRQVSTQSDIYAIGVIFYQLLTNHYPYDVDKYSNDELIALKPWNEELKPPSHYNTNVSKTLDGIVLKCLKKDSSERYLDAGELLRDVEKAIDESESLNIVHSNPDVYHDDYETYIINDSLKEAFRLAKCENGLSQAIEILQKEILKDYDIRKAYSQTLRIWKSKRPDLKLISNAFTVNLKAKNYHLSCDLLREAIAYNPILINRYEDYIELWKIFIDLNNHKSLFKAVMMLENIMQSSTRINDIYADILGDLKTYSVDEIVARSNVLADENRLVDAANLLEFAVIVSSQIRQEHAYKMSLYKQNMKMNSKTSPEIKEGTVDYGIDLGTTDSLISHYNHGNPVIIRNHITGEDFTPSAVLIEEDNLEVGANARKEILKNNPDAVSEFKYDMGFHLPFTFENSSRVMLPEELSAEVLKDLRVSAYRQCGQNMEHAVIGVPANSNPIKTRAIIDAAELAGFKSYNLIMEPIAVALAYNLKKPDGIWMIYDMGGSTFNSTLVRENNGEIEKLATAGLDNLGGNAFDWKIVNDLFKPQIINDLKLDDFRYSNPEYSNVFAQLKNAAESAKIELTKSDKADISIEGLLDDYGFNYTLTRETFKKTVEKLIKHTFDLSRNLLDENSLADDDIESIILVGGSSLSPILQDMLSEEFDIEIQSDLNPLTAVSKGAAVYAGSIKKPEFNTENEDISLFLNYGGGHVKGRVFASDLKPSFLGYSIEFKNPSGQIKIPLDIDGCFKFSYDGNDYDINIYKYDELQKLDLKSPNCISSNGIHIPYFKKHFTYDNDLNIDEVVEKYSRLIKKIDYLNQYADLGEDEICRYIEMLLELARKDENALNPARIYIDYLQNIVLEAEKELKFTILLENVSNKIDIIEKNSLFEIESIDDIVKDRNLEKLESFHRSLVERYVELNRQDVVKQCYFNLKLEGIYVNNRETADELFKQAQNSLNAHDYQELLDIVNRLYGLDERREVIL